MSPKQSLSTSLDSHEWGKDRFDAGRYEQCKNLIAEHGCVSTIIRRLRPLGGVKEPQNMCELSYTLGSDWAPRRLMLRKIGTSGVG